MTTGLVVSVTDELVAELEEACREHGQGFMVETEHVLRLLAERAEFRRLLLEQEKIMQSLRDSEWALIGEREELLRDAGRYRLFAETIVADCNGTEMTPQQNALFCCMNGVTSVTMDELAAMFDAAMQSEDKL